MRVSASSLLLLLLLSFLLLRSSRTQTDTHTDTPLSSHSHTINLYLRARRHIARNVQARRHKTRLSLPERLVIGWLRLLETRREQV